MQIPFDKLKPKKKAALMSDLKVETSGKVRKHGRGKRKNKHKKQSEVFLALFLP